MFDFGELDSAEPREAGEAKSADDDEEAEELRRLEQLRLEEEAARQRREEAEAAARRRREEREREEQRRKLQEEEEARKRKEAEAEAERRRQEREAEEQRQKAEALRRREEEEAQAKLEEDQRQEPGGAAASAGEKFDELEKRLEEEERQARGGGGGSSASTAPAAAADASAAAPAPAPAPSTPREAFKAGDIVEIQIYVGKWVACSVSGAGSKPDTYCIHILPTELYDKAAGRSDQDVADVPSEHLRKATQPSFAAPASNGASTTAGSAEPTADAAANGAAASVDTAASVTAANVTAVKGAAEGGAAAEGAAGGAGAVEGGASAEGEETKVEEEAKAEDDAGFTVGVRVAIKGLTDKHEHLNGVTATLIEKKWKGNWIIDLDDEEGKKRRLRRRWLLNTNNLQVSDKKGVQKYFKDLGRPKQQYFVVGTWNEFVPRRMTWDHDRLCWTFEARMGHNGVECFQIWLERDKKKSVHPDTANAGNYVPWELEGPDNKGENKNWSIGSGKEGERFELRLFLWEDESPQAVEWGSMQASANKKSDDSTGATKDSVAKKCPRKHDLKVFKPPVDGYSCSKCNKTFPKGTTFYSCRPCDYDECETCASAKADDASSSPTAKAKAPAGTSRGVAEDARKFLDQAKNSDDGKAAGDNKEALKVGDRVTITSNGPYRGKHGTVMKVDEDGDPAVRLETGDAKLFYRADVAKAPPESAKPQVAPSNGFAFNGSKGLGKGKGVPMGYPRTPGVLGFGAS